MAATSWATGSGPSTRTVASAQGVLTPWGRSLNQSGALSVTDYSSCWLLGRHLRGRHQRVLTDRDRARGSQDQCTGRPQRPSRPGLRENDEHNEDSDEVDFQVTVVSESTETQHTSARHRSLLRFRQLLAKEQQGSGWIVLQGAESLGGTAWPPPSPHLRPAERRPVRTRTPRERQDSTPRCVGGG